jgi:hypothetical protein
MRIRIIMSILLFILVTGCATPTINTPVLTDTSMPEWTPTSILTATFAPTFTPSPTYLPTQTPTIKPFPSWTPLPTLEPTGALLYVEDLLLTNAGCRLPCWWGITPGKTTWVEAQHFLESFTLFLGLTGKPKDLQIAYFGIPFPEDIGTIEQGYGFRNGIVEEIYDIYYGNLTTHYNLVEMLNTYGQPDHILISAYFEARYSDYMVMVAIFYLQKGILVEYFDNDGGTIGDKIQKCPQKATYPHLTLWSPRLNMTIQEAANRYLDTRNWPPYKTLQESTGMNVEAFYNKFKDPNNDSCLALSVTDWPKP